jgi:hypothetical protein
MVAGFVCSTVTLIHSSQTVSPGVAPGLLLFVLTIRRFICPLAKGRRTPTELSYGAAVSDTDDVWRVSGCRGGNTEKDQSLGQALIAAALGVENVFMAAPIPWRTWCCQTPVGAKGQAATVMRVTQARNIPSVW